MNTRRRGFSLIELSVVLVILGLIVGGIMAGRSLVRASEMRSLVAEQERYTTGIQAFRDKYAALPGDMPKAVKFWGAQAGGLANGVDATCAALTTGAAGPATCNGNGDGMLGRDMATWYERYRAWQHLVNAGLVEGSYTGITTGALYTQVSSPGVNVPKSKMTNGSWFFAYWGVQDGSIGYFAGDYGNALLVGVSTGGYSQQPLLTPTEAWNLDSKIDDGRPGTGSTTSAGLTVNPDCSIGGTNAVPEPATYNRTYTSAACALIFKTTR